MAEALGVARHDSVQGLLDLTLERGVLLDEVAAMAAKQLQGSIELGPSRFDQAEAVGGGAEDGGEVGVVSLVAGVGGLPEIFATRRSLASASHGRTSSPSTTANR
jgi:ligand-binding sensor domain-containing protein